MASKVKKDDVVVVLLGKDRGKKGKVMACEPKAGKVLVEGVNIVHKHTKPKKQGETGGIVSTEASIDASNVMPVCPKCDKSTRVGFNISEDGKKTRICKKCGSSLDK